MECEKCNSKLYNTTECEEKMYCVKCEEFSGECGCENCGGELKLNTSSTATICQKCGNINEKQDKKEEEENTFPPIFEQASNFADSMVNFAKSGFKTTDEEEKERRLNICYDCDRFDKASIRCLECGCKLKAKANIDSEKCPLGKWKN
jgi:hypothetical protein